jgi:hypothetical protein
MNNPPGKFRLDFVLTPHANMSRRKAARITLAMGGGVFLGDQQKALSRRYLNIMLECLTKLDIEWLKAYPNTPRLAQAGMLYREEPPGQEDWQDIPTCLLMGIADCVPASSPVVMMQPVVWSSSGEPALGIEVRLISELVSGDLIFDGTGWAVVKAVVKSGQKKVLRFDLTNDCTLRCTSQHRVFRANGEEVRAEVLDVGNELLTPPALRPAVIRRVTVEEKTSPCVDIETSSGRFFLPAAGVIVHNCEDLAAWVAAERTVKDGIPSMAVWREFPRPDGLPGTLFHIVVERADGVAEDPSALYGMR